jgi:hypothetical protein
MAEVNFSPKLAGSLISILPRAAAKTFENRSMRTDVMDFESLDFFACTVQFQQDDRGLSHIHAPMTLRDWRDQWTSKDTQDGSAPNLPNISIAVDVFSKAYYSLLLSDFNSSAETMSTNALSTGRGLEYLQAVNDTDLARAVAEFRG